MKKLILIFLLVTFLLSTLYATPEPAKWVRKIFIGYDKENYYSLKILIDFPAVHGEYTEYVYFLIQKNSNGKLIKQYLIKEKIIDTINSLDEKSFMIREKLPIIKKVISKKFDLKEHIKELKEEIAPLLILSPGEDSKISSFIFKIEKLYSSLIESNQSLIDKTEEYVKEKLKNIY